MTRVIAIGILAMVGWGCGSAEETPSDQAALITSGTIAEVATLQEGRDETEQGESDRLPFDEGLLLFTTCIRDAGFEVPDIPVDPDGQPILSSDLVERIDTEATDFAVAFASCVPILTAASPTELGADPELVGVLVDALRRFSVCMRENGVERFPDPAPGWNGSGSPYPVAQLLDTSDPDTDTALEQCSRLITFPSVS